MSHAERRFEGDYLDALEQQERDTQAMKQMGVRDWLTATFGPDPDTTCTWCGHAYGDHYRGEGACSAYRSYDPCRCESFGHPPEEDDEYEDQGHDPDGRRQL